MKRVKYLLAFVFIAAILAVSAFATVGANYDLVEVDADSGIYKIVTTIVDDEGDFRAWKSDVVMDYNILRPVSKSNYSEISLTSGSSTSKACYNRYSYTYYDEDEGDDVTVSASWLTVQMTLVDNVVSAGVEMYVTPNNYPANNMVVLETFVKVVDGYTVDDFTADTFKIEYIKYANGSDHWYGNEDSSKDDMVVTNNVVPEPEAPVVITISVKTGDKVYLQDGTVVNIDANNDAYEVPPTVGYVAVNSGIVTNNGFTAQKTYYIDGKVATAVHDNALYGTADIDLRVKAEDADRNGLRFRTLHNLNTRSVENNEIAEIGFIMAAETDRFITKFGSDYDLTLDKTGKIDGVTYAKVGIAYGVENGENVNKAVDKIGKNTGSDKIWDIRAVMYNIPEDFYQTTIACRPYYKVGEAVVYGEVAKMTLYDAAKSIKDNAASWEACNEDQQAYINSIIEKVEGPGIIVEDEVIIDIGGLYE